MRPLETTFGRITLLVVAIIAASASGCTAPPDGDVDESDLEDRGLDLGADEPTADEQAMAVGGEEEGGGHDGGGSSSPSPVAGPIVSLQSHHGYYVVAEGGGGGAVNANRNSVGEWEKFRIYWLGGANVALKASNGQWVVAEGGGGGDVNANRSVLGPWETFTLVNIAPARTAFRSTSVPKYVVAEQGGGADVNANRDVAAAWETFWMRDVSATPPPHSVCTTGSALKPEHGSCVLKSCVARPECCTSSWDSTCVANVPTICGHPC